jgi:hypothetical protein
VRGPLLGRHLRLGRRLGGSAQPGRVIRPRLSRWNHAFDGIGRRLECFYSSTLWICKLRSES